MRNITLLFMSLCVLCACEPHERKYVCDNYDVVVQPESTVDEITVSINGDVVVLKRVQTESGDKYTAVLNDVEIAFVGKKNNIQLFLGDEPAIACKKSK